MVFVNIIFDIEIPKNLTPVVALQEPSDKLAWWKINGLDKKVLKPTGVPIITPLLKKTIITPHSKSPILTKTMDVVLLSFFKE